MNKRYEIVLTEKDALWTAYCKELRVIGVGETKEESLQMLIISMRSTLSADAVALESPGNINRLASILTNESSVIAFS